MYGNEDVTVIVPAFNPGPALLEGLASVIEQSPGEILVIDDCSSRPFPDLPTGRARVQLIRHSENLGPGAARNTGIEAATGRWICYLDADDRWARGRLNLQLRLAHEHGCDVVMGKVGYMDLHGGEGPEGKEPRFLPNLGGMLVKREVAKLFPLDETSNFAEDLDFYMRVKEKGLKIHKHDDVVLWYRRHPGGITWERSTEDKKDDLMRALRRSLSRRRAGEEI